MNSCHNKWSHTLYLKKSGSNNVCAHKSLSEESDHTNGSEHQLYCGAMYTKIKVLRNICEIQSINSDPPDLMKPFIIRHFP